MSNFANPENAYVWLDGDAFRGPAGMKMPADPFAPEVEMDAFGGIEAGFELTSEQAVTKLHVFNYRKAAYKVARDPLSEGVKFRAVDNTKATVLTRAQGGSVKVEGGHYTIEKGIGEEFSLLLRLDDGDQQMAIWCERATLSGPAVRAAIDGKSLDGWEFSVEFLTPPVEILPGAPEGLSAGASKTVTLPTEATGGTWTLSVSGKATSALAHNATAETVQTALRKVDGATTATVSGAAGGPYTVAGVTGTLTANGTSLTSSGSKAVTVK